MCALCVCAVASAAQGDVLDGGREASELQVKAAYLLKFGEFVQWPASAFASADAPLVIAVAGADALAAVLERMAQGKRVDRHALQIKRLRRGDAPTGGHIVFVAPGELERLLPAADSLKAAAVLTVTDGSRAPQPTGIFNYVARDGRVRFEIDAQAADAARLRISSKVLSLALDVKGVPRR
jgi:hypothetical protein